MNVWPTSSGDLDQQWATAAANAKPDWEVNGGGVGGALGLGNGLQSLPLGESEVKEVRDADSDGLPSYRSSSRSSKTYGSPTVPTPTTQPVRCLEDLSPEEAALEEYLMNDAVDSAMWLHHARLEHAHSRYAVSIKFSQLLEEIELDDVRRGTVPLVPGTGMKMPTWIRASEELEPQLDAINAAQAQAEIIANDAELQRMKDVILAEVEAAEQLLAITDPFAGVSIEDPTAAPEALDELYGDAETLLPGARIDLTSTDMMEEMIGKEALERVLDGDGSGKGDSILKGSLAKIMKDVDVSVKVTESAKNGAAAAAALVDDLLSELGKSKTTKAVDEEEEEMTSEEEDDDDEDVLLSLDGVGGVQEEFMIDDTDEEVVQG